MKGNIYLIPSLLAEDTQNKVIPDFNKDIIQQIRYFLVENIRSARRFISSLKLGMVIDSLELYVLDKNTPSETLTEYIQLIENGHNVGIISEAGCPGIADPGALLVDLAHQHHIKVIPLVGASSIFMALMASGMNGQSFAFQGYLPIQNPERAKKIQFLEKESSQKTQTQIFMETPYRNQQLFTDLLKHTKPSTKLCIACNITATDELIRTHTIEIWKSQTIDLHKKPTIFVLQAV
jgi:16S rRNA (cytidine1402-2'-O)-methyltransferase